MLALVSAQTREVDAALVAGVLGVWLWRKRRTRLGRKTARAVACVAAVVVGAMVSPTLCGLVLGAVVGVWAWKHRHPFERRRFQKAWNRGYRRGYHRAVRRQRWARPSSRTAVDATSERAKFRASPEWARQRADALKRAHRRCEVHGCRGGQLEVHHNNNEVYDHLFQARPSDLTVLCSSHHHRVSYLHQHCVDPATGQRYTIAKATRMVMQAEALVA